MWKKIFKNSIFLIITFSLLFLSISNLFNINVEAAGTNWTQNDWTGGRGSFNFTTSSKYHKSAGLVDSSYNNLTISPSGDWYNTLWRYRKEITINHDQVAADLTDFPLMVKITGDNDLKAKALANGYDLLFTMYDGKTKLDHEIEKFDKVNGDLIAWIKIPSLSSIEDDSVFLYYGNPESSDQQNKSGVWQNYAAVYHLNESSSHQLDSTSNANNTVTEAITQQGQNIGIIGNGDYFNGTNDIAEVNTSSSLMPTNDLTVETWFKADILPVAKGENITLVQKHNGTAPYNSYTLQLLAPNDNLCSIWNNSTPTTYERCGRTQLSADNWYYAAQVKSGSSQYIYLNGADDSDYSTGDPTGTMFLSDGVLSYGASRADAYRFNGYMDEIRISSVARPPAYFTTTYNNVSDPVNFYSVSAEQGSYLPVTWYNSSWSYRKQIIIDHTKVTEDLTNYPLLINLNSDGDLHNYALSNGNDILFTSSNGTTKLDHEIETYVSSTGQLVAWVRVPNLSSTINNVFYIYFGNAGASNQQNKTGVWQNYAAVYHLSETSGTHYDSTSNGNNTISQTLTTQGGNNGVMGKDDTFGSDSDLLTIANNSSLLPSNQLTVEMWVKPSRLPSTYGDSETILRMANSNYPYRAYTIEASNPGNNICTNWANSSNTEFTRCNNIQVSVGNWSYIAQTVQPGSQNIYFNGYDNSDWSSGSPSGTILQADQNLLIGSSGGGAYFRGDLDEIRISSVARSSGYFSTTYNNEASPSTFYSIGSLDDNTPVPYTFTGYLISSIYDPGQQSNWGNMAISYALATNTNIKVKVRSSYNNTMYDTPSFKNCNFINSGDLITTSNCVKDKHRYIQYAVYLITDDLNITPTLHSISLDYANDAVKFIERTSQNLYLNENQFKFSGTNMSWLGLKEIEGGTEFPSHYAIDDALTAAQEMGANVVRNFGALSVGCANCIQPSLGTFNDNAFQSLDYAIKAAKDRNIRFIMPLVDNWKFYHGGKHNYTEWRSLANEDLFYSNVNVISDYKNFISHVLNHVNPYTGLAYKDDPTIMGWETGNEMRTQDGFWTATNVAWSKNIATYIKTIAYRQLVLDGHSGSANPNINLNVSNLLIPSLDMYSTHFYPAVTAKASYDANMAHQYNKAYFVGEYDWTESNVGIAAATFTIDSDAQNGSRSAKFDITHSAYTDYFIQLSQSNIALTAGHTYNISFYVKSSAPRDFNFIIQKGIEPYTVYSSNTVTTDTSWQQKTFTFTATDSGSNNLFSLNVARSTGQLWIDNVVMTDGSNPTNLVLNPSFESSATDPSPWYFQVKAIDGATLDNFLTAIENNSNISGDLYWSMFPHADTYGNVEHGEIFDLNYPENDPTQQSLVQRIRQHAYTYTSGSIPSHLTPTAPVLNPLTYTTFVAMNWRGASASTKYQIERSLDQSNWTVVSNSSTDYSFPNDSSVTPGNTYYYRVKGLNLNNVSGPYSNIQSIFINVKNCNDLISLAGANNIVVGCNLPNQTTSNTTPKISGLNSQAATVTVDSTPQTHTVSPDSYGYWTFNISSALGVGIHTITLYNSLGQIIGTETFSITSALTLTVSPTPTPAASLVNTGYPAFIGIAFGIVILSTIVFVKRKRKYNFKIYQQKHRLQ